MISKSYIHYLLIIVLTVACWQKVEAQDAEVARQNYLDFVQAASAGNNVAAFNHLYEAYKSNTAVLKSSARSSSDFLMAKQNLMQMWPYLENAAVYYANNGHQSNAVYMAEALVDMTQMEEFNGTDFNYSDNYPKLAYYAASNNYNARNFQKAIPYLEEYLRTGDTGNRQNVYYCLAQAFKATNNNEAAITVLKDACTAYPSDYNAASSAINICMEAKDYDNIQFFLDKAKALKPNDKTILNIQAKVYEDNKDYENAYNLYKQMRADNPTSLEICKHTALNAYNLGTLLNNKAMTETDKGEQKKLFKQANAYFEEAQPLLEQVVQLEPSSTKYNNLLAVVYSTLKKAEKLEEANKTLASLGMSAVSEGNIPQTATFGNDQRVRNNTSYSHNSSYGNSASASGNKSSVINTTADIPKFSVFAKSMIEDKVREWQQKDPYETAEEYMLRVNENKRNELVEKLRKEAESEYIKTYVKGKLTTDGFTLKPYDADNGVFLIESWLGQLIVPVPRENNEARVFEQSWNGVTLSGEQYRVSNDKLALASVTFETPTGKSYTYSAAEDLSYTEVKFDVNLGKIDYGVLANNDGDKKPNIGKVDRKIGKSDVDNNIPECPADMKADQNTFVLIIANEDYKAVSQVPFTTNDGEMFAEYCKKTLGIPESNIKISTNATFIEMRRQIRWLSTVIERYNGEARAIVYYAGHGIPDEATGSAYLLPVDGDGTDVQTGFSLETFYQELSSKPSRGVIVLLDACFSGATREGGMLAAARGVAIKAKPEKPKGSLVVFSAASGDETAWPYKEQSHGMFTYYLLKKLQETQGEVSMGELADYVTTEVSRKSITINSKSQTPNVLVSESMGDEWKSWSLKR